MLEANVKQQQAFFYPVIVIFMYPAALSAPCFFPACMHAARHMLRVCRSEIEGEAGFASTPQRNALHRERGRFFLLASLLRQARPPRFRTSTHTRPSGCPVLAQCARRCRGGFVFTFNLCTYT
jgi:hypothetical protein